MFKEKIIRLAVQVTHGSRLILKIDIHKKVEKKLKIKTEK
jgi:hypothetical protein